MYKYIMYRYSNSDMRVVINTEHGLRNHWSGAYYLRPRIYLIDKLSLD